MQRGKLDTESGQTQRPLHIKITGSPNTCRAQCKEKNAGYFKVAAP